MKIRCKNIKKWVFIMAMVVIGVFFKGVPVAMAIGNGLTVSPMFQKIIVNPGEAQTFSFQISNPASAVEDMHYGLSVEPFYVDEQGDIAYKAEDYMSEIVNWVSFDVPVEGKIEPNGEEKVIFTIDVPESAPAGGQYFSIIVTEVNDLEDENGHDSASDSRQATIKETYRMAHLVYAEVTGNVVRQGEIVDVNLPSFLLSGEITGSASIKNTGNVHGEAVYTMQVYPLFSDEEVFTNVEAPETKTILPNRTVYHETKWENTPGIGIFNVIYTVEFEGSTAEVSKMVIICPIWLLFLIVFAIAAIVIWLVMRARGRRK